MSMADYLAIPAVSNGALRAMLDRCPAAAWHESAFNPNRTPDDTEASDAGTIAHAVLLEGSRECLVVIIDPYDHPNATKVAGEVRYPVDGWTNKSIRAARDAAREAGKIPILPTDQREIETLVEAAQRFIKRLQKLEPHVYAAFQPDQGDSEVVFVWKEGGTLCKARADRISKDFATAIDYKSTKLSVHPDAWARTSLDYLGAAWYRRGIRALTGVDASYVFLCGERDPPYLHSLIGLNPQDVALGDEDVGYALREWQKCEAANEWPEYPARACYPALPVWRYAQSMERQGGDERAGIPIDDMSKLFGPPKEHPFSKKAAA